MSIILDMEESDDLYDVRETNDPSSWEDQHPQCLQDVAKVECLRRKIKYYFMNPCEKYHARGRKPWKLILQIIKIAIITIQVHGILKHDPSNYDLFILLWSTVLIRFIIYKIYIIFFPYCSWFYLG